MRPRLLILGGTAEASALAALAAARGIDATLSFAGRVASPRPQPVPVRTGGFGGVAGLALWLREQRVTGVGAATHPFAARIGRNAVAACAEAGVPLVALVRPPWVAEPGDRWTHVRDVPAAVAALAGPPRRVFLAIGRQSLAGFGAQPQHRYLLRLVDPPDGPPDGPPPLPQAAVVVSRGPFTAEGDAALMRLHGIDLVVSKTSGGDGARAKLDAARALGLPFLMIARPEMPARPVVAEPQAALDWLSARAAGAGA
jgi:precorrin-6A/cobalt-precorrin-6A reductase